MARLRVTQIEGIETVRSMFRNLPRRAVGRITHALNLGADEIVAKQKELVPYDETSPGPHLRDTIHKKDIRVKTGKYPGVVIFVVAGDTKRTADAAWRSEYGRELGGKDPNAWHPGHDPQAFFFAGFWAVRRRVRSRVARAFSDAAKASVIARG